MSGSSGSRTEDETQVGDARLDETGVGTARDGSPSGEPADAAAAADVHDLLATSTEAGRLERARKLADEVQFLVADAELVIAAVSSYNVLIDAGSRRIVHGCRDFQGQARSGKLCKHVAAVLLALDAAVSLPVVRELVAEGAGWGLEVVTRFGSGR